MGETPADRGGFIDARGLRAALGALETAIHAFSSRVSRGSSQLYAFSTRTFIRMKVPARFEKDCKRAKVPLEGGQVSERHENARAAWARAKVLVWPERYVLATFPVDRLPEVASLVGSSRGAFAALVVERDEVSLTLSEPSWRAARVDGRSAGPFRVLTVDVDLDLDLCGFLAPLAALLADAGVPVVPQCAFLKDHVLVRDEDLDRTVGVIEDLIRSCARGSPRGPSGGSDG